MTTAPILRAVGIVKQYDKFTTLGGVDLRVMPDTVHSVIGPNDAGKATLLRILTDTRMITSGTTVFDDHDVTREADYQRVQCGIVRSFQMAGLLPSLSMRENLHLAAFGTTPRRALHGWCLPQDELAYANAANRVLDRPELPRLAGTLAAVLSHGQQCRLEVGMALIANLRAIPLDKPTSGIGVDGLSTMRALIRDLVQDHTVVLIGHNMDIVMGISDMITVMRQGKVLMEDTPDAVRVDPRVRATYPGNMITGDKA